MSVYGSGGDYAPPGQGGGYAYGAPPKVRFDVIGEAWRLFQQQMGAWIVSSLVFLLVAGVFVGIFYAVMFASIMSSAAASGGHSSAADELALQVKIYAFSLPMSIVMALVAAFFMGGMYRMAQKQIRGEAIAVGDMFSAGDIFGKLAVVYVLTGLATNVGAMLCYIPAFIVGGLFMLAPMIVVDKRIGGVEAIKESINAMKSDWLNATLFFFVLSLLAGLGGLVCGIGAIFTLPLMPLSLALVYRDFFGGGAPPPVYPGEPSGPANPWTTPGGYAPPSGGYTPPQGGYNPPGNYNPPR